MEDKLQESNQFEILEVPPKTALELAEVCVFLDSTANLDTETVNSETERNIRWDDS